MCRATSRISCAQGDYQLDFRHRGFEDFDSKLERGINRLTVGAIISASTIAAALILNANQNVLEFELNLLGWGRHTLSVTSLLGIAGYSSFAPRMMLGTDGMHCDMLRSAKATFLVGQATEGIGFVFSPQNTPARISLIRIGSGIWSSWNTRILSAAKRMASRAR